MAKEKINYTEAFKDLQIIVAEIEGGDIPVDDLSEKVSRAARLIKVCRLKLSATEDNLGQILKELDDVGKEVG